MEVPVSNVLVVDTLYRFFSTPIKWGASAVRRQL